MNKITISYIFPIYNEADNIPVLYRVMSELLQQHPQFAYELLFINDGSKDSSLDKLIELHNADPRIIIVNLSRNFGHQMAVTAGLDVATGDAVIIMDSDMQDPPRVSFELIKKWQEGYDVVYAQRRTRKDTLFKRATADLFYRLLARMADITIPRDTGDFRLLDAKVVAELRKFKEQNRFLRGIVSSVGFKQTGVLFDRDSRHSGQTGYPLKKMLKFAFDGIVSFSSAPLRMISQFGFFMSLLSFGGILYALMVRLLYPNTAVPGWAFIVIAILLVGGIQLIMLGVLGMYIGRIYTETQHRPLYIVSSIFGNTGKSPRRPQLT